MADDPRSVLPRARALVWPAVAAAAVAVTTSATVNPAGTCCADEDGPQPITVAAASAMKNAFILSPLRKPSARQMDRNDHPGGVVCSEPASFGAPPADRPGIARRLRNPAGKNARHDPDISKWAGGRHFYLGPTL